MANAAIIITGLTHSYGDRKALDNLTLQVGEQEMFGLLGPNGGGKSTLFKILSTLMAPSGGNVQIFGVDVTKEPAKVRGLIGVVFQSPALDKKLTVEENLIAQGYLYGQRGSALCQKVELGLKRMGLWDRRQEMAEKLSGGLKRRVEIAKALLHSPRLLILDEPTTGLDPAMRRELWDYLKQLQTSEGITVVVTTHLMEEADRCDRIALIDQGNIVAMGAPEELRKELGGDVIVIRSKFPEKLREKLSAALGTSAQLSDGELRVEKGASTEFLSQVLKQFPEDVESLTWGRPTLEDLFLRKTGRRISEGVERNG